MKARSSPFSVGIAILALATVADAQDRGRSGGEDRSSRSRTERGDRSRSRENRAPERSDRDSPSNGRDRSSGDRTPTDRTPGNRNDRSGPDRTNRPEPSRTGDFRPDRGRSPFDRAEPDRGGSIPASPTRPTTDRKDWDRRDPDRGGNGRDRSPFDRRQDDRTPSRDRNGGSRNPFDRFEPTRGNPGGWSGRNDAPRPARGGDVRIGTPSRDYRNEPWRYDGRGRVGETRYGAPPRRVLLNDRIRRTDVRTSIDATFGGLFGGLRVGYVGYDPGFARRRTGWSVNASFGYPYYAYDPYAPDVTVVASPWYRYSYLPPYVDHTRVIVVQNAPAPWGYDGWDGYERGRRDAAIDDALDDLRDAFEDRNDRLAERLVPDDGEVAIFNDGRYDYSLGSGDFEKMFLDGIDGSATRRYEILETRTRGEDIRIRARHEYEDSWGEVQSVVHRYTLRRERGGDYVVREFGTE